MHLLLLAYEFPPIESAHGLRWGYLARELALRGHTLDVVAADLDDTPIPRFAVPGITMRRAFAGPFVGGARALARRTPRATGAEGGMHDTGPGGAERLYRGVRALLDQVLVPDVRTEWLPWGLRAARAAIAARRPDAVIASHEPGVDLAIARLLTRAHRLPLLADLGDPMLAIYAPRWRRRIDAWFEQRWLRSVDAVTVTTAGTRELLQRRVARLREIPVEVLSQGFDPAAAVAADADLFDPARLELLYTGTLYADFRDPQPLLDALPALPHARLTIIGGLHGFEPARLQAHAQVRYLGRLPHARVLAAQRAAHVLVNLGNRDDVQVPGKLFEYFGAARPLLHVAQTATDPSAELIVARRRGLAVAPEAGALAQALRRLEPARGGGDAGFDLDLATVDDYSWPRLAQRVERLLEDIVAAAGRSDRARGAAAASHAAAPRR